MAPFVFWEANMSQDCQCQDSMLLYLLLSAGGTFGCSVTGLFAICVSEDVFCGYGFPWFRK